jgi:hypothetical protein
VPGELFDAICGQCCYFVHTWTQICIKISSQKCFSKILPTFLSKNVTKWEKLLIATLTSCCIPSQEHGRSWVRIPLGITPF